MDGMGVDQDLWSGRKYCEGFSAFVKLIRRREKSGKSTTDGLHFGAALYLWLYPSAHTLEGP